VKIAKNIKLYPPSEKLDLGNEVDNHPPIYEGIEAIIIKDAYVGCYGYVTKNFKNIEHFVSPRHRNSIGLKSILSNYFIKKKIKVDTPIISIAHGWYDSYYHFTLECLVKVFLLRKHLPESTIIFPKNVSKYHLEWFQLLDVKNILFLNENEVAQSHQVISCNFPEKDLNHHSQITPDFRNWIIDKINNKGLLIQPSYNNKIFINRPNARHRKLMNESEVIKQLQEFGFNIIELEKLSVLEQINLFYHSKVVLGIHGAGLTNCLFMKKDSKVIDFIHEKFIQHCFLKLSKILELDYSQVKCKGNDNFENPGICDIEIEVANITELL